MWNIFYVAMIFLQDIPVVFDDLVNAILHVVDADIEGFILYLKLFPAMHAPEVHLINASFVF